METFKRGDYVVTRQGVSGVVQVPAYEKVPYVQVNFGTHTGWCYPHELTFESNHTSPHDEDFAEVPEYRNTETLAEYLNRELGITLGEENIYRNMTIHEIAAHGEVPEWDLDETLSDKDVPQYAKDVLYGYREGYKAAEAKASPPQYPNKPCPFPPGTPVKRISDGKEYVAGMGFPYNAEWVVYIDSEGFYVPVSDLVEITRLMDTEPAPKLHGMADVYTEANNQRKMRLRNDIADIVYDAPNFASYAACLKAADRVLGTVRACYPDVE